MSLSRLSEEFRFCWNAGLRLPDKVKLVWAAIVFHIHIRAGIQLPPSTIECSIRIDGKPFPVKLRPCQGDFLIFVDIVQRDAYRLPNFFDSVEIETVLDLGAHIGLTALVLANRFPRARFLCVEPDTRNLALLRHNLACLKDRVIILEGAVGGESGELFFQESNESWGGQVNTAGKGRRVPCFSIEELIRRFGVDELDVLKADIEGAERAAFHDAFRSGWPHQTKCVIAEYHEGYSGPDLIHDLGEEFWLVEPSFGYGNLLYVAVNKAIRNP